MERLKAFTLLEITVAMLLTGVLAVLAYGILGTFNAVAQRSFGLGNDLQQIRNLQQTLIADSDRANSLLTAANGFVFMAGAEQARYTRTGIGLLRAVGEQVDTFDIALVQVQGYWNGQRVTGSGLPVEHMVLTALTAGDTMSIAFTQHYDAVTRRVFD
jgi:prepilin-type N-terminal cleavage/methylation domain-containing protein